MIFVAVDEQLIGDTQLPKNITRFEKYSASKWLTATKI